LRPAQASVNTAFIENSASASNRTVTNSSTQERSQPGGQFELVRNYVELVGQAQPSELYQWLEDTDQLPPMEQDLLRSILYQRLLEFDPVSVFEHINSGSQELFGASFNFEDFNKIAQTMQLMRQWTSTDLNAASEYVANIQNTELQQLITMSILFSQDSMPMDQLRDLAVRLNSEALLPEIMAQQRLKDFADNPQSIWDELVANNDSESRQVLGQAIDLWGRLDPVAAMEAVDKLNNNGDKQGYYYQVIYSWANEDSQGALNWVLANTDKIDPNMITNVFSIAASKDNYTALNSLGSLDRDKQRFAADGILGTWAQENPESAADWIRNAPEYLLSGNAIAGVMQAYTQKQPNAAWDWALSLPSHHTEAALLGAIYAIPEEALATTANKIRRLATVEMQTKVGARLVQQWIRVAPQDALQWIQSFNGEQRDTYYNAMIEGWSTNDPTAALNFVDTLPSSDQRDNMYLTLMSSYSVRRDPILREQILNKIDDPEIYQQAKQIQDPY
jgi:hypothetical protein